MRGIYIKPQKTSNAVLIKSSNELNSFLSIPQSTEQSANQHKRKASNEIDNASKKPTEITTNSNTLVITPKTATPTPKSTTSASAKQPTNKPPTNNTAK